MRERINPLGTGQRRICVRLSDDERPRMARPADVALSLSPQQQTTLFFFSLFGALLGLLAHGLARPRSGAFLADRPLRLAGCRRGLLKRTGSQQRALLIL